MCTSAAHQVNGSRGIVVFGIVRPCTHRLSERLRTEWMAHLCGLCLALRADHGQFARIVTNYDGLIVSVLTEAQTERTTAQRRTAGPCPLRSMRTAPVARGEGARLAAAVSLVLASAKVRDHVADRDGLLKRRPVAAAARRVAMRLGQGRGPYRRRARVRHGGTGRRGRPADRDRVARRTGNTPADGHRTDRDGDGRGLRAHRRTRGQAAERRAARRGRTALRAARPSAGCRGGPGN